MLVGCSGINISAIVKHEHYIGIIRAFCLPVGNYEAFQYFGDRKIAGQWFAKGVGTQTGTVVYMMMSCFFGIVNR